MDRVSKAILAIFGSSTGRSERKVGVEQQAAVPPGEKRICRNSMVIRLGRSYTESDSA
ncbi:hypothetical protein P3T40_006846 [Paraburkholderia sp. EB58]|jgi:hypothetical protein